MINRRLARTDSRPSSPSRPWSRDSVLKRARSGAVTRGGRRPRRESCASCCPRVSRGWLQTVRCHLPCLRPIGPDRFASRPSWGAFSRDGWRRRERIDRSSHASSSGLPGWRGSAAALPRPRERAAVRPSGACAVDLVQHAQEDLDHARIERAPPVLRDDLPRLLVGQRAGYGRSLVMARRRREGTIRRPAESPVRGFRSDSLATQRSW